MIWLALYKKVYEIGTSYLEIVIKWIYISTAQVHTYVTKYNVKIYGPNIFG